MKKSFSLLSLVALMFFAFSFTTVSATTNVTPEMETCNEVETVVSTADLFGSGKFYGCYIAQAGTTVVTYQLVPTAGPIISGTISCQPDFITLSPFTTYDVLITTNAQIWLFLQWDICVPGSLTPGSLFPGTTNVGTITVFC